MTDLTSLLHRTFGHPSFRANQEAVCRAATDGRDVLLVMPTGAGKSLCYQLPAIARGGTALVVSPLIALMDDQAAKLTTHGLRVGRIHSGLTRDDARKSCRDYLDGSLDFLFVAPERLRVPGFPQMLARRKPSLVAIDEAHCISAWGHDFRPDYRTLGEHLPALRPAPILALTATATPTVQRDIVAQLHLEDPALFIHGFRRANLAIEVVEMSKPRRHQFALDLLRDPAARPAIVYAPSRKSSEELAAELNHHFPAASYHAGLAPSIREQVQSDFQSGKIEVVVATIAFGMGIDKANIRTVIHTTLPASVEAFYQEIGRAGRDGLPSCTVLLHSFADRKMHEFFLERDYPPATDLARVAQTLTDDYLMPEPLAQRLKMDLDTFNKAIEKLIAQGAASIDLAGNVRRTAITSKRESWRAGYDAQIAFRRAQIDSMVAFAETQQCRMTAIIRHFGDTADAHRPCGQCDFCSPTTASAQTFASPTPAQARHLRSILTALAHAPSRATGKLHTDLALPIDRREFDTLLDALARAGLITLTADTFLSKEDGRTIPYKKAALTHEGCGDDANELTGVLLPSTPDAPPTSTKRKRTAKSGMQTSPTPAQQQLEESLRAWRKAEAAGKPAFIVLGDAVLRSIAIARPQSIPELLTVHGVGPGKADRFGAEIVAICRNNSEAPLPFSNGLEDQPQRPRSAGRQHLHVPKSTEPQGGNANVSRYPKPSDLGLPPTASEHRASAPGDSHNAAATFSRPHTPADLTPAQQNLDAQLRAWRRAEAARIGMPQFYVLGSSALHHIVLQRPQNLAQLTSIAGVDSQKAAQFGAAILHICNS